MNFEESSLIGYLVKNLQPLTAAEPVILSKYVAALLKKEKPLKELQKLCSDKLVEFLGDGAKSFTEDLFQALEDGSIVKADRTLDVVIPKSELFQSPISPNEGNLSTSSERSSDPEDIEGSDDDDDRNHKHRRRETRQNSLENDAQELFIRRPNRKLNKPYNNGPTFMDSNPQSSDILKEYNPASERNIFSKFDKNRSNLTPILRPPLDIGPQTRFSQPLLNDTFGRPSLGRRRGRSAVPWSQHDSRFNPHGNFDYASQMASQGPSSQPGLFVGAGLPSALTSQSSSWGGFGFIPGMPNGIMDPLNPLGLQGALHPTINPPLNFGIPRQRCRDFEERGFCLRGDMCPMEHGLNRIVVEDVQSLSQFNLPVSVPSSHGLGIQANSGPLPPVPPPNGHLANNKTVSSRSSKSGVIDNTVNLNDVPSSSGGADADVYDPDQPLWNSDPLNTSATLLRLPSSKNDDEPSWDLDTSGGIESKLPSRGGTGSFASQSTDSSVWGRISSRNKLEQGSRGNLGKEIKEDQEGKTAANLETGTKETSVQPFPRSLADSGPKNGRAFQKALRTLYVNGIPQKSNRRDVLMSHFQKFGEVIDIYIPFNGEKAFIQFSKREEAEAAFKSPDAIMGNRFIKVSWANRDRITEDGQSSSHYNKSVLSSSVVLASSVPSNQPVANGVKETPAAPAQTRSNVLTPIPAAGPIKIMASNTLKAAPLKKVENLELLEELRRKQESLTKKRDEFKRQLEKFEKQAVSIKKGDAASEQAAKRHKVDTDSSLEKAATPKSLGLNTIESQLVAEKIIEKKNSDEFLSSSGSKVNILQQSFKNSHQTSPLPASLHNRFKLDNRSTSFRILPPLPPDLANAANLKDHFSRYGAISSVVLEDPEARMENEVSKLSENCSACITFATRQSAERAYQTGKSWEGHNLQFKWVIVSSNTSNDIGIRETSSSSSPKVSEAGIQPKPLTSGVPPLSAEKSTCTVITEVDAVANLDPSLDIGSTDCPPVSLPMSSVDDSQLGTTISSIVKCPSE